jgi:hypothetical protein
LVLIVKQKVKNIRRTNRSENQRCQRLRADVGSTDTVKIGELPLLRQPALAGDARPTFNFATVRLIVAPSPGRIRGACIRAKPLGGTRKAIVLA